MAKISAFPSSGSRRIIHSVQAKAAARRTFSQRLADRLTSGLGSMAFLSLNLIWFIIWIIVNLGIFPSFRPFDPYPFGLLTMIVSLEAIFLSVIVLVSENRAAQVANLREETDLQINIIAEEEITKIITLIVKLLKKQGIDPSRDPELKKMLQPTDTEKIEKSLQKQITS